LIEIGFGSKTAEKKYAQTNKQTNKPADRQTNGHYENNGHLAVNQRKKKEERNRTKYNVRISPTHRGHNNPAYVYGLAFYMQLILLVQP